MAMSGKREESLAEASETLRLEQRNLNSSSLEYVWIRNVETADNFSFQICLPHARGSGEEEV